MKIEHVAIWTDKLEELKDYYIKFFGGIPNEKYRNEKKQFESYFLTFNSGTRLELMTMPNVPDNLNDRRNLQHKGLIHLAFAAQSESELEEKAKLLREHGYEILSGPRVTGDGYYEFETLDPDNNRVEITVAKT